MAVPSAVPALPPLHNAWLGSLTGLQDVPGEPRATCGDCVMCAGTERSGSQVRFLDEVKCCSHIPNLPNFLAGQGLNGAGGASIRARIAHRSGVTPLGLGVSHADVYRIVRAQPMFGRSADVICPHFQSDTRSCGIWESRNAVCSTWFCQHGRGAVSQRFWHAVRDLLMAAEERLAYLCLTWSGLPEAQVHTVLAHRAGVRETIRRATATEAPDDRPDSPDEGPEWYAQLWGDWEGREETWFVHCAALISQLSAAELSSWMGGVQHLTDAVVTAWQHLQVAALPEPGAALRFAPGPGSEADGDVLRLVGYSPFDPVSVATGLLGPLRLLDAVPSSRGGLVDDDLLRQLLDFGVVIPADS